MSVNSITGEVAVFRLQSLNGAGSLDKPVAGIPSTNDQSTNQTVKSDAVVAETRKVSSKNNHSPIAGNENNKQTVRAMSHVVESYNQQGKLRVKFLDSHNNLIYQIPSEMVAKTQDLMADTKTAADLKG